MAFFGLGSRSTTPNRLGSVQIGTSEYGVACAIGWGRFKAPLKLLDDVDFSSVPTSSGGKGSGPVTGYEYYSAIDAYVTRGPIGGMGNVYDSGGSSSLLPATETYTIPSGGGTHAVAHGGTAFYYDEGVTYPVNYSLAANDFGSDGSVTLSGTQPAPFQRVPSATGAALTYTVDASGNYAFPAASAGITVTILYTYTTEDTSGGPGTPGYDARSPLQRYNLSLFLGTKTQAPWGYMESRHPERALGYAGDAHVTSENMDLGSSATVPSLSIEVLNGRLQAFGNGIADCDPAAVITDLLSDADAGCSWDWLGDLTTFSNFCVANNLFISPFYDSVRKATDIVSEICDLVNAAAVWSGSALKIVPYGDTSATANGRTYTPPTEPVYEIDEDECICEAGADAVEIGDPDLSDNFNRVTFQFQAANDNYNTQLIHEQDEASILMNGPLPMKTVTADHFKVQLYAAIAMNMALRRASVPLKTYRFTLPWYYELLEPMDILVMNLSTGNLGPTPMRLTSVEENDKGDIQIEAEDFLWGLADGVRYPKGTPARTTPGANDDPGNTALIASYQPTARLTGGGPALWLGLTGGTSWGGCDVQMSLDGTNYSSIGEQYGTSRGGHLTAALAAGGDPDTTNTAAVTVAGSLGTVSESNADDLVTLSLVGSELIAYETASITASTATNNSYTLGYLRRGAFSSGVQAHVAGEAFLRLDDQVFKYVLDPSLIGKTVYLKLLSFNLLGQQEQPIASVPAIPIFLGVVTSSTMSVGSFANASGGAATVTVYLPGGAVGASGSATLANGATVTQPPYSWTTAALNTWYGVNYNPATAAYVLYTDRSAWLADQATMLAIGTTTTPASTSSALLPNAYNDAGSAATDDPAGAYTAGQVATVSSSASFAPTGDSGGSGPTPPLETISY